MGEEVHARPLGTHIIDADLRVRNTTVGAGKWKGRHVKVSLPELQRMHGERSCFMAATPATHRQNRDLG